MSAHPPAGGIHLVRLTDAVTEMHSGQLYVTVCGALVDALQLPSSCCPEGCGCDVTALGCPDCARQVVQDNTEAGQGERGPGAV